MKVSKKSVSKFIFTFIITEKPRHWQAYFWLAWVCVLCCSIDFRFVSHATQLNLCIIFTNQFNILFSIKRLADANVKDCLLPYTFVHFDWTLFCTAPQYSFYPFQERKNKSIIFSQDGKKKYIKNVYLIYTSVHFYLPAAAVLCTYYSAFLTYYGKGSLTLPSQLYVKVKTVSWTWKIITSLTSVAISSKKCIIRNGWLRKCDFWLDQTILLTRCCTIYLIVMIMMVRTKYHQISGEQTTFHWSSSSYKYQTSQYKSCISNLISVNEESNELAHSCRLLVIRKMCTALKRYWKNKRSETPQDQ